VTRGCCGDKGVLQRAPYLTAPLGRGAAGRHSAMNPKARGRLPCTAPGKRTVGDKGNIMGTLPRPSWAILNFTFS